MKERMLRALQRTWQAIGPDVLQCLGEGGSLSREEVVETVLDADHVRVYGDDAEAAEYLYSLPYAEMKEIAREEFSSDSYSF